MRATSVLGLCFVLAAALCCDQVEIFTVGPAPVQSPTPRYDPASPPATKPDPAPVPTLPAPWPDYGRRTYMFAHIHVVSSGDTIWNLAEAYGVPYELIERFNSELLQEYWHANCPGRRRPPKPAGYCSIPESTIQIGMTILIPEPALYIVPAALDGPDIRM
ncbi:MAG: hypothetical protein UY92_C0002G0046 [Candidatus Magasanikbacteria bacterium GW2011_GWA2_56_11]|uniref:LysM domain-containing protein n=1 Tax=Candidatus Magasanikbacteria bacterium GW2011_GWA2_56_11 TaxID=1619044 RepID=A0A0G2BBJ1_9BACT|nr:MAG: hypothetical protein UY92_C0002G0046 [Candidatus Magasanikbacteria bacterium GW2011_GWA2_56_11]